MNNRIVMGLLMGVLLGSSVLPVQALELKGLDKPIPVMAGMAVTQKDLKPGLEFYATVAEPLTFQQGWKLPEGTQFIGHVDEIKTATLWRRGSHLAVWIDQVVFPSGKKYLIYPHEQIHPNYEFHPKFWGSQPEALIGAGQRLDFVFNPGIMRGMMQMGACDEMPE